MSKKGGNNTGLLMIAGLGVAAWLFLSNKDEMTNATEPNIVGAATGTGSNAGTVLIGQGDTSTMYDNIVTNDEDTRKAVLGTGVGSLRWRMQNLTNANPQFFANGKKLWINDWNYYAGITVNGEAGRLYSMDEFISLGQAQGKII